MAIESPITKDDHWFIGAKTVHQFVVYTDHTQTVVKDVTGYAMRYVLRRALLAPRTTSSVTAVDDPVLVEKATGGEGITISGTFNSSPALNTLFVFVTIDAEDTEGLDPLVMYRDALMRTDDGEEDVLSFSGKRGVQLLDNPALAS